MCKKRSKLTLLISILETFLLSSQKGYMTFKHAYEIFSGYQEGLPDRQHFWVVISDQRVSVKRGLGVAVGVSFVIIILSFLLLLSFSFLFFFNPNAGLSRFASAVHRCYIFAYIKEIKYSGSHFSGTSQCKQDSRISFLVQLWVRYCRKRQGKKCMPETRFFFFLNA